MAATDAPLFVLASALKVGLVAYYADLGVDLPLRRVILPSGRIDDCEQLAIQVQDTQGHSGDAANPGEADARRVGLAHAMRAATVNIWVERCVPGPKGQQVVPSVADQEAAAALILQDHEMLKDGVLHLEATGVLPGCAGVALLGWEMLEPAGGIGGSVLRISVDLSGW